MELLLFPADDNEVATMAVSHEHADIEVEVDGYQDAGSYVRPINYVTQREVFDELIERSSYCEQYIKWRCKDSKLLSEAGGSPLGVCYFDLLYHRNK